MYRRFNGGAALPLILLVLFGAALLPLLWTTTSVATERAPQGRPCTGHAQGRCGRCVPNGCAGIFIPQYIAINGLTRPGAACLDLDGDGNGHCCYILKHEYDIKQGNQIVGFCFMTDCEQGTAISPLQDCSGAYRGGADSEDRCYANNNPVSTPQ